MKATSPALLLAFASAACGTHVLAQTPPDYDFTWRTIGDLGNAPAMPSQRFWNLGAPVGSVDHEYRMAQTEVTNTQYLQFVLALTAAIPNTPFDGLEGADLTRIPRGNGTYEWQIFPGTEQHRARMGWSQAAMYCNWLTNGKATNAAAFLTGAYDVSTFWPNQGPPNLTHLPGALFWLPTRDEWVKAMFYDPNKLGPGMGDYWMYPISSDTPPVGGWPGMPGAQTGAGDFLPSYHGDIPVGAYSDAHSPWGILDGSGGVPEWCEGAPGFDYRWFAGTDNAIPDVATLDRLDHYLQLGEFRSSPAGIRLVSAVPTPGVFIAFASLVPWLNRRRR
jgi:hypothetical protein